MHGEEERFFHETNSQEGRFFSAMAYSIIKIRVHYVSVWCIGLLPSLAGAQRGSPPRV